MGVDRAYVRGLEPGNRNPTIVTLWHIAKALGGEASTILRRREAAALVPAARNGPLHMRASDLSPAPHVREAVVMASPARA